MRKQEIDYILTSILEIYDDISDINVTVGNPFRVERFGQLSGVEIDPPFYELTPFQTEIFALNLINRSPFITETLLSEGACEFSYSLSENLCFDVNISLQRNHCTILIRKGAMAHETKADAPEESDTILDMMFDTTEKLILEEEVLSDPEIKITDEESAELDIDLDDIDLDDIHEIDVGAELGNEDESLDLDLETDTEFKTEEEDSYFDDTMEEGDLTQVFEVGIPGSNFQVKKKKAFSDSDKPASKEAKSGEEKKKTGSLRVFRKLGKLFGGRSQKSGAEKRPEFFKPMRHGLPDTYPENKDPADCTIFCSPTVKAGTAFLLQVFVHWVKLVSEFTESDKNVGQNGFSSLETDIDRGSEVIFELSIKGVRVEDPVQRLKWEGKTASADYEVEIPAEYSSEHLSGKVLVSQSSVPFGHIRFKVDVIPREEELPAKITPEPLGEAKRYKYAFLSYAPEEHSEVLRSVLMLSSMEVGFPQESVKLNPQERWKRKLYLEIDKADVFFLFWSAGAYKSEWVKREVIYALRKKKGNDENPPEIIPVINASAPKAPKELKYLRFSERPPYFTSARL